MISIDGSIGDGGGQAVRTALSLAAATGRAVEISNIRQSRRAPGLNADLVGVARAVAEVTHGRVEGETIGSSSLSFMPGTPAAGRFDISLRVGDSAGSAPLALLAIAPALALANGTSEIILHGTTHAAHGPTATYVQTVTVPTVRKFGVRMQVATPKWCWSPTAVGELRARIEPSGTMRSADLTQRGEMLQIGGSAVVSGMDAGFAERQRDRVSRRLAEVGRQAQIQITSQPCESMGGMVLLLAVFERTIAGFSSVSRADVAAEQIADEVVNDLFAYLTSYAVLDKYVTDQALVFAALADGVTTFSTSELTERTLVTAEVIRACIPALVSFDGKTGKPADVEVVGVGGRR